MAYIKTIVCLANSYKYPNGRCIAGKEIGEGGYGGWIRPVSDRPTAELSLSEFTYENRGIPKLLDVIEVPLARAAPRNHQAENHLVDTSQKWTSRGRFSWEGLDLLCDQPETIWTNSDSTNMGQYNCMSPEDAARLDGSLLLIKKNRFTIAIARNYFTRKLVCRAMFNHNGVDYNFSLTDPDACVTFERKGEGEYPLDNVYLCLSLTEPYDQDGRCHKLVAGVISKRTLRE